MSREDVNVTIMMVVGITVILLLCGIGIVLCWGTVKAVMGAIIGIAALVIFVKFIKELCEYVFEEEVESK